MRKPSGCCCSSARWPSRPAVRARIGTAFTDAAGKPRSSITAAIGIATFIVSGLPQASAAASRNARARATCGPADAALVGQLEDPLGAGVERAVDRVAEAGQLAAGGADLARDLARDGRGLGAGLDPLARRTSSRAHSSAVPRMTGPQPRIPAATAPWSDPGSAASVIRAATFVGIIPCSAIATSSRSRKKRWSSVGSSPVSSRWKYSVNDRRPIRSPREVAPADLDAVGLGLADVADGRAGLADLRHGPATLGSARGSVKSRRPRRCARAPRPGPSPRCSAPWRRRRPRGRPSRAGRAAGRA